MAIVIVARVPVVTNNPVRRSAPSNLPRLPRSDAAREFVVQLSDA
jgi:hypothetical protein